MSFVVHRVAKSAARYTDAGGREKCGYCRFFVPPRSCGKVIGPVSPMGWCKHFSCQMVSQSGGGSTPVGGGPPGMTLALDFMFPGTLDPRITFTRASTATYTDSSGTIQTAAINAPRWDYANGVLRGLLIEEARTNICLWSADFTPGHGWNNNAIASITRTGTAAPDGTALNLITEDTSSNGHLVYGGGSTATAATYVLSMFVRAGTQRYISMRAETGGSGVPWITFDTQTQTINANAQVISSGFSAVGGGTYRIWLSWAASAGAATVGVAGSNVATAPAGGSGFGNVYVGTGQTFYAWGAQVEAGAFPTSYIPTTSVSVTRAQDFNSMSTSPWLSALSNTWFAEFISFGTSGGSVYVVGGNTTGAQAALLVNNATYQLQWWDGIALATTNSMTLNAISKGASAFASGTAKLCLNGGPIVSGAANGVNLPTVGFLEPIPGASTNNGSGYMRRVQYWNRALSDAEMQQVTT